MWSSLPWNAVDTENSQDNLSVLTNLRDTCKELIIIWLIGMYFLGNKRHTEPQTWGQEKAEIQLTQR